MQFGGIHQNEPHPPLDLHAQESVKVKHMKNVAEIPLCSYSENSEKQRSYRSLSTPRGKITSKTDNSKNQGPYQSLKTPRRNITAKSDNSKNQGPYQSLNTPRRNIAPKSENSKNQGPYQSLNTPRRKIIPNSDNSKSQEAYENLRVPRTRITSVWIFLESRSYQILKIPGNNYHIKVWKFLKHGPHQSYFFLITLLRDIPMFYVKYPTCTKYTCMLVQ